MSDVSVEVDESGHVAILEIRRGPNNFFDVDLIGDLADALDTLASGAVRAVVLCSEGKHFCAGADFSGASGAPRREGAPHLYDLAIRLFEQPLPIVAAVQGAAIGGGLGLALAADFRVATPDSRFAANFALLGFHHGFGLTVTLPLVVGHQAAIDLLYTGRRIDGSTRASWGCATSSSAQTSFGSEQLHTRQRSRRPGRSRRERSARRCVDLSSNSCARRWHASAPSRIDCSAQTTSAKGSMRCANDDQRASSGADSRRDLGRLDIASGRRASGASRAVGEIAAHDRVTRHRVEGTHDVRSREHLRS